MVALGNSHTGALKRSTHPVWRGVQVDEGWPVRNTVQLIPKEMTVPPARVVRVRCGKTSPGMLRR